MMLLNPFTPSEIASGPEDFFGRNAELKTIEQSLLQGSIAMQGPVGIGKSSLLAQSRLLMEGFNSPHRSISTIAVGDKDIKTIDQASRLLLEGFIHVDESQNKITFKVGSLFAIESMEVCRNFKEGRHLAALKRIVEEQYLKLVLSEGELLLLAIDEADKFPVPLARLIRSLTTHTQQQGVKRVRFVLSGASPFFQKMVDEDPGISRFFYKTITLQPMPYEEATELIEAKLMSVLKKAEEDGIKTTLDEKIIPRIVTLSGGHPHILQLLGSHLIQHENEDPDGSIDDRDLFNSLRRICYEDRTRVYNSTIHLLEINGKLDALKKLVELMLPGFPGLMDRQAALEAAGKDTIHWLVENDILSVPSEYDYGFIDEFLRIRLLMDEAETKAEETELEERMIRGDWRDEDYDLEAEDKD